MGGCTDAHGSRPYVRGGPRVGQKLKTEQRYATRRFVRKNTHRQNVPKPEAKIKACTQISHKQLYINTHPTVLVTKHSLLGDASRVSPIEEAVFPCRK